PATAPVPVIDTFTVVPSAASVALIPPPAFSGTDVIVVAVGALRSTVTVDTADSVPTLPAWSVTREVTLTVPSPCDTIVAAGTVTAAVPAVMSAAVSVYVTDWPPQFTVSVSPATAPVPPIDTFTVVPFEASLELMPPPAFSGIELIVVAVGALRSTVTVDTVDSVPTLPAWSVTREVTLTVPSPCDTIVAAGTVTAAVPAVMSAAVSVYVTDWPPQFTVSVSPATAPVPPIDTFTVLPFEASLELMPPPAFSGIELIVVAVGALRSTVTVDTVDSVPTLPAWSVTREVTLTVPSPCDTIVAAGTVTAAVPAVMSAAVSVYVTDWPPQFTVSVSPATAPVPPIDTFTVVPFEASLELMPPPAFSGIELIVVAVGALRSTVTVDTVDSVPTLPAWSVTREVTLTVPSPCATIVAAGTVTAAVPAVMSDAVSVYVTDWPPQFTVSVSPATAPVPP